MKNYESWFVILLVVGVPVFAIGAFLLMHYLGIETGSSYGSGDYMW